MPRSSDSQPGDRWWAPGPLELFGSIFALLLYVVPIGWGLPNVYSWAFDEPLPREILPEALGSESVWPERYPPLHRYLLRALFSIVDELTPPSLDVWDRSERLALAGRGMSVGMSLATLAFLYLAAGFLAPDGQRRAAGRWAAGLWLGVAPQAYYAKTMNLDAPMLFWFALSVLLLLSLREDPGIGRSAAFAVAAAAAILTKDNSYALYVLPGLFLVRWRWKLHRDRHAWSGSVARTLADPVLLAAAGTGLLAAVLCYRLWAGTDELARHLEEIRGPAMLRYREYDNDLAGHLAMAARALYHLAFCLGWPSFLLLLLAIGAAAKSLRRPTAELRREALLWTMPLSHYLFFVVPIRFHYDRFFLPAAWIACLLCGLWLGRSRTAPTWKRKALSALAMLGIATGTGRAVLVDVGMMTDRRYVVEQLADALLVSQAPVEVRPRMEWRMSPVSFLNFPCGELASARFLVLLASEAASGAGAEAIGRLLRPGSGFIPRDLPSRAPPGLFLGFPGALSNLDTIDPNLLVFERTGDPCAAEAAAFDSVVLPADRPAAVAADPVPAPGERRRPWPFAGTVPPRNPIPLPA